MSAEFTATRADIERWLKEAAEECRESDWQGPYRLGYLQGLTAVLCKMDDARRAAAIPPRPAPPPTRTIKDSIWP